MILMFSCVSLSMTVLGPTNYETQSRLETLQKWKAEVAPVEQQRAES
jgi:hypothetical protein